MADFLQNIYFSKIIHADGGTGFTNQMFALTSSIIKALFLNKRAVAVDSFGLDYGTILKKNISDVIDLEKTNEYLKEKYNIILLDKNAMKFKLHKAYYGIVGSMFDITNEISGYISKEDNSLFIPKNIDLNSLQGDPYSGVVKHFCIYYSIDQYNFMDNFGEILPNDIMSKVPSDMCKFDFAGITMIKCIPDLFNDILKNIHFIDDVKPMSLLNHNIFKDYDKVNTLHLRLEEDALQHWGKQNDMSRHEFKIYLENKYIELIKKYFQKNELTIVLTYSSENSVIKFMKDNGYAYLYVKKDISKHQREIDAIYDLYLSTKCNNVFMGNFWMKTKKGSSFSYYILQKLEFPNIKKISIFLDNIKEPEDVFY